MPDDVAITAHLQARLHNLGRAQVNAIEAARWLGDVGLLDDSIARPGLPLRNLLRAGRIGHAYQLSNGRWFIGLGNEAAQASKSKPPAAPPGSTPPPALSITCGVQLNAFAATDFKRTDFETMGFCPFVTFEGIDFERIPRLPGVYAVLRENDDPPTFLDRNPAGWFRGVDPTAPVAELKARWPSGAHCVYIGKADMGASGRRGLRKRISEFRKFGDGLRIGHSGGRRIWQLADAASYVIAWKTVDEDPGDLEADLLQAFVRRYGALPIGNRTIGRR